MRMHGGIKVYRGSATAARIYVEADRSRADDYYLAEGTGLAERYVASPAVGDQHASVLARGTMDGDAYERWVAGHVLPMGAPKGRLRTDAQGVRFVEVVVNGPKTWSLAAALHPEIADAYDAAQGRAANEIIGWIAEHATTRIGPRGRQVQVPVEEIEAAVVRHYTSRAGDPHRHLHLQINARVWAAGRWRGLHTVGIRDSLDAINGIGHAAAMCDPGFRAALASHGYTLDPTTGEVAQLAPYVGAFSARTTQIRHNVDRYEAEWRVDHPHQEPGPKLRQAWDRRAWAQARPDKVVPQDGSELARRWVEELRSLGFTPPLARELAGTVVGTRVGTLDRVAMVETALTRLSSKRSAWNAGDIRGEMEQQIASAGVITDPAVRQELAEDLTARAIEACTPLLSRTDVPEHVRSLTSPRVLAVEERLTTTLTTRAEQPVTTGLWTRSTRFDDAQRAVLAAIDGRSGLLVVEGAAGAGKTTTLEGARRLLEHQGHWLLVVTPTLKAAQVATRELGTRAFSAAWLAHQHGFRWDADGLWTRETGDRPLPAARLGAGDVLLVDEAGMLDQDTALALLTIADENRARVVLMGDRHQLPAVGRGGVLDLATACAPPAAQLTLEVIHRFDDPAYADLSLLMRRGQRTGDVFDTLLARGEICIHASEVERRQALAVESGLVVADTHEQVDALNAAISHGRVRRGEVDPRGAVTTSRGERIGIGDKVATRRNDPDLDVANRDTWTVTALDQNGGLQVTDDTRRRHLPPEYVERCVELAYASTAYGAQGQTVDTAHIVIGEHTGAAAAYVAMTRGRQRNTAHLVADSVADARAKWTAVFARDRADLGPTHARRLAVEEVDRYGAAAWATPLKAAGQRRRRQPEPDQRRPEAYPARRESDYGIGI
jgi:exodeoxyribonuclease V alpha subunit